MKEIHKPTMADLTPLVAAATENGKTLSQWLPGFLAGLRDFLLKNPLRYRGYGPWWWVVKKALLEQGLEDFGTHLDAETVEAFDTGDAAHNVLAAYAYSDYMFELGKMTDSVHSLDFTDGDSREYIVADEDMETLALGRVWGL
jgi:hypothetical protein